LWWCWCECGNVSTHKTSDLLGGQATSCGGCELPSPKRYPRTKKPKKRSRKRSTPRTRPRIWDIWRQMIARCYLPSHAPYRHYGGRGIRVCVRWHTYENFVQDMGHRPPGRMLDRINNDGNYEPGNCRWATPSESSQNRRTARYLQFRGELRSLTQWSRHLNLNVSSIRKRLELGWSVEQALATPFKQDRPSGPTST
jgi:hypothetical protein